MNKCCAVCGQEFVAKRSTARYCSSSCRANASKAGGVVELPPQSEQRSSEPALVVSTRKALEDAGRGDSPLGLAALELATALSASATPPGAKASLAKQLESTLSAATKGTAAAKGPGVLRDELAERRAHGA